MEGLVALLSAQKPRANSPSDVSTRGPSMPTPGTTDPLDFGCTSNPLRPDIVDSVSRSAPNECRPDIVERGVISSAEADALFRKYVWKKAPYFPFVVFSHDTDAQTLRRDSPFLFLAIMTASVEDQIILQKTLWLEIREIIGRRIVVAGEKSLDLLQGLLVHVCWYHYRFQTPDGQMIMFLSMAVALLVNLGRFSRGAPCLYALYCSFALTRIVFRTCILTRDLPQALTGLRRIVRSNS